MPGDGGERLAAGTQLGSLCRDHLRNGRNDGIALLDVERDAGEGSTPLRLRPLELVDLRGVGVARPIHRRIGGDTVVTRVGSV